MYGALTGKSKQMIANEYGEDQLKVSIHIDSSCSSPTWVSHVTPTVNRNGVVVLRFGHHQCLHIHLATPGIIASEPNMSKISVSL
jgi:hypothetical protein